MRDGEHEEPAPGLRATDAEHLSRVERHWRGLAPPGSLPRRRDIDAASLGPALPQALTLEEIAPGLARVRVAGQMLHEWFGGDPRGAPLSTLFDDTSRPALREALVSLFLSPAMVELPLVTPRRAFRTPVTGRLLLLPLLDDDGACTRALGTFGFDMTMPPGARRFGIGPGLPRIEPLLRRTPKPVATEPAAPVPGLAESPVPWLRLVVSNG